jgi:hypothetical protein
MVELPSVKSVSENLQYIRRTMEAAGQFTAVPGKSMAAVGVAALGGVAANEFLTGAPWSEPHAPALALDVWGIVLALSLAVVGLGVYRKAELMRMPIQAPLIRKLLWGLCPALFLGAVLTNLALATHEFAWLPAIWLGCYGAAIASGGQVSIAPLRYLGVCLLLLAAAAALTPAHMGLTWMALGFGWLHLLFGAYIAWRYHG